MSKSFTIHDLSKDEYLRGKLIFKGLQNLKDEEFLAIFFKLIE